MSAKIIFDQIPHEIVDMYGIMYREQTNSISYGDTENHTMIFDPTGYNSDKHSFEVKNRNGSITFYRNIKMVQTLIYSHVN